MLYKNDLFELMGKKYRMLFSDVKREVVWAIAMDDDSALPIPLPLAAQLRLNGEPTSVAFIRLNPSAAMKDKREEALMRIRPLVDCVPDIYSAETRGSLVSQRAIELGCSKQTLYKDLRRWFQGGQTPDALLAKYYKSGRSDVGVTMSRGRRPAPKMEVCVADASQNSDRVDAIEQSKASYEIYQLTQSDLDNFRKNIEKDEKGYLKDLRCTQTAAFQRLLERYYTVADGNGDAYILDVGNRPSQRQFTRFLQNNYSLEVRLRGRKGDKEFELNHAAKLGTVGANCRGVGHYYEIDATIADLFLVSESDRKKIIGKPTLYLIIDRKSRLIVGFYCGLENASWTGAMQAIFSIATDKRKLCERYGVKYDPEDWPAHMVFPSEFLGDRGPEMLGKQSNNVCDGLAITVTNLPAKKANHKPLVECSFKLTQEVLKDVVPAYDPPANATKRQGKQYEQDACLTLDEFIGILLRTIIAQNRKAMPRYNRSLEETNAGVLPIPTHLWNHDIPKSANYLTRYSEEQVRHALLPKDKGIVTEVGISFNDCFYSCPEGEARGWFIQARNSSNFSVNVTFDYRLVDTILIHDPSDSQHLIPAHLTPRSEKYLGMSFAEVRYYKKLDAAMAEELRQNRHQVTYEYHQDVDPVVAKAKAAYRRQQTSVSRTARRADTKAAREVALRKERDTSVNMSVKPQAPAANLTDNIISLPTKKASEKSLRKNPTTADGTGAEAPTTTNIAQQLRKKMLNAYQ